MVFEKRSKIDTSLTGLTKRKRQRTQIKLQIKEEIVQLILHNTKDYVQASTMNNYMPTNETT